ncbi:hypothetical protein CDD82_4570 [Ophiocordyceps australis]|uniref:EKC/KEOPS complex subunit CGI121 n=1 Tax=Ophiocordyceps australis TaxID=1399860 RepID=A0A2C5ZP41_9HYPO|nr:hypothetical protein CDD82_4570 [Ophiocordyceps australis]
MALDIVSIEHLPAQYAVHIALFRQVSNAAFLQQQLLSRNAEFEYAFVDASTILSRTQLLSSIFKAVIAASNKALKTPNVHSETVLSLSASNNITDAYRRFGISPSTQHLAVIKITCPPSVPQPDAIWSHLMTHVQGHPIEPTDMHFAALCDLPKVRKYYKLNGLGWLDAIKSQEQARAEMDKMVLSAMALRGV